MDKINGTTPQDINKLNTNLLKIGKKLFNKFTFDDLDLPLKSKIRTSFITLSDVGQLDSNVPHTYHFYISPTKDITKKATISILNGHYKTYQDNLEDGGIVALGTTGHGGEDSLETDAETPVTEGHTHEFEIYSHTHSVEVNVPNHKHKIIGKVAISNSLSSEVIAKINGHTIATLNDTDKTQVNEIDITGRIIKGWNAIRFTSNSLARIVIYGTIELEKK